MSQGSGFAEEMGWTLDVAVSTADRLRSLGLAEVVGELWDLVFGYPALPRRPKAKWETGHELRSTFASGQRGIKTCMWDVLKGFYYDACELCQAWD